VTGVNERSQRTGNLKYDGYKYLYISSGNRRKVQLKMNENNGVDAGMDYFW